MPEMDSKEMHRMKWSIPAAKDGVVYEFDGVPIMSAGNIQFHCHQGVDIDLALKTKRKQMQDEKQVRGHLGLFYIYHLQLSHEEMQMNMKQYIPTATASC